MASPYSQPIQYKEREDQFNLPLLQQALGMRQEKYDYNRAKVQQTINNLAGLDLIRGVDQDYLYERLEKVVDTLNQDGSRDVSLDSQADYLSTYVSQVADDKIVNAYYGTQSVRNIQSQAEAARESGEYSDDNYNYSMQDAMAWMANPEAGAAYRGRTDYVPYADMNEAMLKSIQALQPSAYAIINERGQYEYYKEKGKILSEATVRSAAELTIKSDPKLMAQAKVNAWAQFKEVPDSELIGSYKQIVGSQYEYYDELSKELKRDMVDMVGEELESAQQQLEFVNSEKEALQNVMNTSPEKISREALEIYAYKNELFNQYAETYAYQSIEDRDYIANEAALELAKQSADVISKVIDYRSNGRLAAAREYYNNHLGILATQGYPTYYGSWSAQQAQSVPKAIDTEDFNMSTVNRIAGIASSQVSSALASAEVMLMGMYSPEQLEDLGFMRRGIIDQRLLQREMYKYSTTGRGMFSDQAVERLNGNPLSSQQKDQLLSMKEAHETGTSTISLMKQTENEIKNEIYGELNSNTQLWIENVKKYNKALPIAGNSPHIEIDLLPKGVFERIRDTIDEFSEQKESSYNLKGASTWTDDYTGDELPVNYATIYYDDDSGKYYYEEGVDISKADLQGRFSAPNEMIIDGLEFLASSIGFGDRVAKQPTYRQEVSEDEITEIVNNAAISNANIQMSLPSGEFLGRKAKINGEPFSYSLNQEELQGAVNEQLMSTFGNIYGDQATPQAYVVTTDNPTTLQAASDIAKAYVSTAPANANINESLARLQDAEMLETMIQNAVKGGGEQTEKSEITLPADTRFYWDNLLQRVVLQTGGEKYDIDISQLPPDSEAYALMQEQRVTLGYKKDFAVKANNIFSTMKIDKGRSVSITEKQQQYSFDGKRLIPELDGFKFDMTFSHTFSKTSQNVNTITPNADLKITLPDGKIKKVSLGSQDFGQQAYADADYWLTDLMINFIPDEDSGYAQDARAEYNILTTLYNKGIIDEETYLKYTNE